MSTPCRYCYRRGLCFYWGHVRPESLLYYRGSCVRAVAVAIAVSCVRTGPVCTPCRSCYRRGFCSRRGHVRPQSLLYYRGLCIRLAAITSAVAVGCIRTGVMFARVYTLSLQLSPRVMFAPGPCSPAIVVILLWVLCTPWHYCYRRGLCSHRRHVHPCVHPITSAIAVGYVRIRVMYARGRCCRLPLQGLETLVLLLLYLMSMPRLLSLIHI